MGPLKDWIKWLLSEDRRRAKRNAKHQLHAYYWDGGPPVARDIRDISFSGLYLHTKEHWHPGTLVRLTLQKTDSKEGDPERSITVQGQVVRSYKDGVGLRFVLPEAKADSKVGNPATPTVDKKTFHGFLRRFGIHKGQALIEYVLILPFVLLLIVNLINFGGFLFAWITVANAARAGANYAILGGASAGDLIPANAGQIINLITQDTSSLPNASSITVGICQNNDGTVTNLSGTCSYTYTDPESPNYVTTTVQVNYTYKPFISGSFQFPGLSIYATLPPLNITRLAYMRSLQ